MDNWIIHEIIEGGKRCKVDYESLANLPDLSSKLRESDGISITESPDGLIYLSVDSEIFRTLDSLTSQVFPATVSVTGSSGFGVHEVGDVVTPSISWRVARETIGEITDADITPMSSSGSDWTSPSGAPFKGITEYTFPSVTTDTSYRVVVKAPGFDDLTIGPLTTKFTRYRYYGILSEKPNTITESIVKSLGTKELNDSGTLGSTSLGASRYFLFAVPGVKTLVVRHSGTDAIVDADKGTLEVRRENGPGTAYTYSWVLVPASSITWTFKITAS